MMSGCCEFEDAAEMHRSADVSIDFQLRAISHIHYTSHKITAVKLAIRVFSQILRSVRRILNILLERNLLLQHRDGISERCVVNIVILLCLLYQRGLQF